MRPLSIPCGNAMLAVDTNVVIRFLTGDDATQHKRAVALFERHTIWLAKTVLLECEWVLRSAFGFTAAEIARAFHGLIPSSRRAVRGFSRRVGSGCGAGKRNGFRRRAAFHFQPESGYRRRLCQFRRPFCQTRQCALAGCRRADAVNHFRRQNFTGCAAPAN